ncbi:hypothetical protein AVEN_267306-1 [Araneus ventricosus]|uniref:Uncharacterized protein n=1 Tax=Araneus ventricosus TaxID=182803 RepID=A0A4Y2DJD6_ARAVE|nr:hypothetical protein AVEN_267306-1 [Araneus ventricosus]
MSTVLGNPFLSRSAKLAATFSTVLIGTAHIRHRWAAPGAGLRSVLPLRPQGDATRQKQEEHTPHEEAQVGPPGEWTLLLRPPFRGELSGWE